MTSLKRLGLPIAAGLGFLAAMVLVVCLIGSAAELENMRRGMQEGFELKGTYLEPDQNTGSTLSFLEDQENEERLLWQVWDKHGSGDSGFVEGTADPNVYLLVDSEGVDVGWAHLAYSNQKAEGTLYVKFGMRDIAEMSKYSRVPMTAGHLSERSDHG